VKRRIKPPGARSCGRVTDGSKSAIKDRCGFRSGGNCLRPQFGKPLAVRSLYPAAFFLRGPVGRANNPSSGLGARPANSTFPVVDDFNPGNIIPSRDEQWPSSAINSLAVAIKNYGRIQICRLVQAPIQFRYRVAAHTEANGLSRTPALLALWPQPIKGTPIGHNECWQWAAHHEG